MKQIDSFVKSRFATYSKTSCPKCGKSPCTCSAEVPSEVKPEETDLSKVKAKLISLVDFSSIADEAVATEVKENILNADAPGLLKMVQEEIEDVSKIESTESYLNGLKEVESELKTFCGEQKTYSAMSEYDVDLVKETKGILGKVTGSVSNIPEPKEGESGDKFFKRCLKWAKNADENPEPELYNDLVKLGKKYNMEVE